MMRITKSESIALDETLLGDRRMALKNKAIIFSESKERLELALDALVNGAYKCAVYYAYTSMVMSAKAFLGSQNVYKHTHFGVINGFNAFCLEKNNTIDRNVFNDNFQSDIERTISMTFAQQYVSKALVFNGQIKALKH